jgi:hypothetical protein
VANSERRFVIGITASARMLSRAPHNDRQFRTAFLDSARFQDSENGGLALGPLQI